MLVDFIIGNKGKANAVSRNVLAKYLTENGFKTRASSVNEIISKIIRERKVPICSTNGKGYFWAESQADLVLSVNELKQRVNAINERIEILTHFII